MASQVIWRNIAWVLKKSVIGAGTAVVEEDFSIAKKMLALVLGIAVLSGAGSAVPRICSENNVGQHTQYESQQRVALLTDVSQPSPISAGRFL